MKRIEQYIKEEMKDCPFTQEQEDKLLIGLTKFLDDLEQKQLIIHSVVSSFLDNLKASDSQTLLEMRERNQEEFIKWCAKNPYAGVDDEWENDIMFMRDVAKYIEDLVV